MTNIEIDKKYCQSCGMPLDIGRKELFGTNQDHSMNDEYCFYCLQDGQYTVDYSIKQMVDIWGKYIDKYNEYAHTHYTAPELRIILNKRLPTLKRWKQINETDNFRHEIINRVVIHINQHLFEPLDTDRLAGIAGLSKYHFRHIFKEITGENTGCYIQRLRLEHIAYQLIVTGCTLNQLLSRIDLYTKFSLSKAFKKHFGLSPQEYRMRYKLPDKTNRDLQLIEPAPEIKQVRDMQILYLPVGDAYKNKMKYKHIWQELINYTGQLGLNGKKNPYLSVSLDEPLVTETGQCRFYLGVIADKAVSPQGKFGIMTLPDSLYAVFRFKGNYSLLHKLYRNIYLYWLPQSGYIKRQTLSFEIYIRTPKDDACSEPVTDVYIPIEKQNN